MITDIFLEKRIKLFFCGNLITGIDSAINFDLVKCVTKSFYTKNIMERWTRSLTKKVKYFSKVYFYGVFKGD